MILTTVVLFGALHGATPVVYQDTTRTITGRWVLNTKDSDDPLRTMRDSMGGPPPGAMPRRGRGRGGPPPGGMPPGGAPPGGGAPRGGGMRGGPGSASPRAMAARRAFMLMALEAPTTLRLEDGDSTVLVVWAGVDSVRLQPNGTKLERQTDDSVRIEYRARHRDGRLELERRVRDAGQITEQYYRTYAGTQLLVVVETKGTQFPLRFRRVYDPAPS